MFWLPSNFFHFWSGQILAILNHTLRSWKIDNFGTRIWYNSWWRHHFWKIKLKKNLKTSIKKSWKSKISEEDMYFVRLTDIQIDWFRNADMPSKADIQIETILVSISFHDFRREVIVPGTCAHSNGNGTNEILESEQNFWGRNKNFWDRFWSNVVHRGRVKTCHKQLYAYEIAYNWLTDYFQVT